MFAKFLELLLHAKAGAISGVFLIGATGALVSVSTSNGVTTIVLTDPSPTPSASASASPSGTTSPTASPTASPSATASATPSSSPSTAPSACSDEVKALALQVQRVNSAYVDFNKQLAALRGERDRATLAKADLTLQLVRRAAVKAIHATATVSCNKHDHDEDENDDRNSGWQGGHNWGDQDEDENDNDKGAAESVITLLSFSLETTNVESNDGKDKDKDKVGITFTGTAESIATQAIAAMQAAFDTAKNAPAVTPKPEKTKKPEATRSPKVQTTNGSQQGWGWHRN
jgi:hypothetical protein